MSKRVFKHESTGLNGADYTGGDSVEYNGGDGAGGRGRDGVGVASQARSRRNKEDDDKTEAVEPAHKKNKTRFKEPEQRDATGRPVYIQGDIKEHDILHGRGSRSDTLGNRRHLAIARWYHEKYMDLSSNCKKEVVAKQILKKKLEKNARFLALDEQAEQANRWYKTSYKENLTKVKDCLGNTKAYAKWKTKFVGKRVFTREEWIKLFPFVEEDDLSNEELDVRSLDLRDNVQDRELGVAPPNGQASPLVIVRPEAAIDDVSGTASFDTSDEVRTASQDEILSEQDPFSMVDVGNTWQNSKWETTHPYFLALMEDILQSDTAGSATVNGSAD